MALAVPAPTSCTEIILPSISQHRLPQADATYKTPFKEALERAATRARAIWMSVTDPAALASVSQFSMALLEFNFCFGVRSFHEGQNFLVADDRASQVVTRSPAKPFDALAIAREQGAMKDALDFQKVNPVLVSRAATSGKGR